MALESDLYIGKRLSFDGQLCTVRYHGPVQGTKGNWIGVEWDQPARGKHNGSRDGCRYYECLSDQPTAGSFIRPNRKADEVRSFIEALRFKYASEELDSHDAQSDSHDPDSDNPRVTRKQASIWISGKQVEEVGFDKIRKQLAELSELKVVILDGFKIARPEARLAANGLPQWLEKSTDIKEVCPKAVELDLSRNLFEEWREIAAICEQLQSLKSLRVDGVRLRDTSFTAAEEEACRKAFSGVSSLRLDSTLLPWDAVAQLTHRFPALTTLTTSLNLYTHLSASTPLTRTITSVSLEDNLITSLSSVHALHELPSLRRLVLKRNAIATVSSHSTEAQLNSFSHTLRELDLAYNNICSWSLIDALPRIFPGLASLRIAHNPIFASLKTPEGRPLSAEDGYMLVIGRLGSIKTLDYSPISTKERLNAETYYLSLIARELSFADVHDEQKIKDSHPRWQELCVEYGEPALHRVDCAVNPNSLAARLIKITLHGIHDAPSKTAKTIENAEELVDAEAVQVHVMHLPTRCTAYSLLGVACKKFSIQPQSIRMVWETGDWVPKVKAGEGSITEWDSDDDEAEETAGESMEMYEVEIVPGTRSIGTWIDGKEARIRVERIAAQL